MWWLCLIIASALVGCDAAPQPQRPAAAAAPLYTGLIKLVDVPAYGSPEAPAIIQPAGRRRRFSNFPLAPELSMPVLERLFENGSSINGGTSSSSSPNTRRRLLQQQQDAATGADMLAPTQQQKQAGHAGHSGGSSSSSRMRRRLQQPGAASKPRPGWTGLWWADAGGVGVAVGPSHAVHTISTAMAVYTLDHAAGTQTEAKVVALQDLFAPVGAANCKEGVYDAVAAYDKATRRYLVTATCGGKGAALLAVTATPDPLGPWFLFMLLADAADTGMACASPRETAVAEAVWLNYDANGVYLSLFNYCPSNPAVQGATILALPKHKVYKGAPNFVYGVFSANQILAALPAEQRVGLAASHFKQCAPAPPQSEADAAAGLAFFVCDHIGPDVSPRGNFTLVTLINTGALWQFVGTRPSSPTPFLTAQLVDRGQDAPLRSAVALPQPEQGSMLAAGGSRPGGFWSGAAALSGGKVYTVDRVDVAASSGDLTMPSLMWTEVAVQVSMGGAGDCARTSAWGSHWDWTRDWSIDWGKDFDLEWKDNRRDADAMKDQVEGLEEAIRQAANCSAPVALNGSNSAQPAPNQVSDGSIATVDGRAAAAAGNCTLPAANASAAGDSSVPQAGAGRRLAGDAEASSASCLVMAWAAATAASQQRRPATEWTAAPLAHMGIAGSSGGVSLPLASPFGASDAAAAAEVEGAASVQLFGEVVGDWNEDSQSAVVTSFPGDSSRDRRRLAQAEPEAGVAATDSEASAAAAAAGAEADAEEGEAAVQLFGEVMGDWLEQAEDGSSNAATSSSSSASPHRRLAQINLDRFIGFDVGCWYCFYGKGFYYSSGWFYRYWDSRNAWSFGWYRRYKRNYAPGWSRGGKFIGRHLLQQLATGSGTAPPPPGPLQNETIVIPPCLLNSTSYKNTCKQCNYGRFSAAVAVSVTRTGVVNMTEGPNPLGFVAPTLAVGPSGSIIIVTAYAGPQGHPHSSAPAYPGVGAFTVAPAATGSNVTWRVLRTGAGKVSSPSGRWSEFSSAAVIEAPADAAAAAAPSDTAVPQLPGTAVATGPAPAMLRVYFGVQWSQRVVQCGEAAAGPAATDDQPAEFEPTCAMPAPYLGFLPLV